MANLSPLLKRIEAAREERGWSKRRLQREAGVGRMQVYRVLGGGTTRVEHGTIAAMARVLGVDISEGAPADTRGVVEREIDVRLRALRERLIALTARERALAYKIMEAIE